MKTSALVSVLVIGASITLFAFARQEPPKEAWRSTTAAIGVAGGGVVGRYQLVSLATASNDAIVLLDSITGAAWMPSGDNWSPFADEVRDAKGPVGQFSITAHHGAASRVHQDALLDR